MIGQNFGQSIPQNSLGGFPQNSLGGFPQNNLGGFPQNNLSGNFAGFPQTGLGQANAGSGNFAFPGMQDVASLSPEAGQAELPMAGFLSALTQAYAPQQAAQQLDPLTALQQQLVALQQQVAQAEQSGDETALAALKPQMEALLQQIVGLLGGQGATGTDPSAMASPDGAGAVPSGGGGGGGTPSAGGGGGGGTPSAGGGGGGGGTPSASGGGGGGGGTAGSASPSGGGGGASAASGSSGASSSGDSGEASEISTVPPELAGDDKKMAAFIETQLKGSPLAGHGLGAHFVKAGEENKVDPLALVAISRHETNFGKLGVGVVKHMGVGAFDSSPNAKRQWDGAVNQIYSGAKTFTHLREKGGSNPQAPIGEQLAAVNKGGWATDQNWHNGVGGHYNELAKNAKAAVPKTPKTPEPAPKAATPEPKATAPEPKATTPKTTTPKTVTV